LILFVIQSNVFSGYVFKMGLKFRKGKESLHREEAFY